jgi:hypothetical protein
MLAILNSLAEYFHIINGKIQLKEPSSNIEKRHISVIYRGKILGIYVTFESIIAQQVERKNNGGVNYFIDPAAKDYIQKYKRAIDVKINLPRVNIREDGRSKLPTYKDVVKRDRIAE